MTNSNLKLFSLDDPRYFSIFSNLPGLINSLLFSKKDTSESEIINKFRELNMSETNKTSLVLEKISNEAVDSKLDKVLNTVKKIDNRCDHLNCKKSTELFGTSCLLCKNRYCFSHSLPEIHGCYDAIRKVEREVTSPVFFYSDIYNYNAF